MAGYFLDYFPCDANGWNGLNCSKIEAIVMMNAKLNSTLKTLILAQFVHLRVLYVGSNCCEGVEEVAIVGLRHLNEITIGENAFTKKGYKPEDGKDAGRRFCLKDCEQLSRLQIGAGSFMDYSVCEIENLPKLLQLQIGKPKSAGNRGCFHWSSLELKSKMTESE